ncbi:unnamed protein product [Rotaria sordida]|uniref:Uncharacterized protein n=1 Tax=Rotaria sordida TaxID=392033 RepID=A0A814IYF8_9BILA|nr:unnamed protein product [Rotaria sordida]CAF3799021.1 unnamed protein product [Rotaria sordida]
MNEAIDDNKIESQPPTIHVVEDSIASRTKEITKRAKREPVQILPPAPKIKKGQREEKSNVDSLELCSILAYSCLKPKVQCFDKKPTIFVLHQLIRNGSSKQTNRTLSKHVQILLSPLSANAYMLVGLSCRYRHVGILLSCSTTNL